MRALLLAAGLGTRLRPITNTIPKCLVEINNKPLLDYWLELLSGAGIQDVLINLHYLPEKVIAHLSQCTYPIHIATVHEKDLLGTGGTLLKNSSYFQHEPVMMIHADNLSLFDMNAFMDKFNTRAPHIDITMMIFYTDTPESCGIVELDDLGIVYNFHEKIKNPPGQLANAAIYILAPPVIDFIATLKKEMIDFSTDVLPHFMGRINTFYNNIYHRDVGNLESYHLAQIEYTKFI